MTAKPKQEKTIKGTYHKIDVEQPELLVFQSHYAGWIQDPKGYFLIRVNKDKQTVEIGYCTTDNKLVKRIEGKTPQEIYYTAIKHHLISRLDHAAYLGKELAKAFLSMKYHFQYVQDENTQDKEPWH